MIESYHPKENPIISVVVTSFNDGAFILEAINSIVSSDFSNFEIIIIDDASTDNHTVQQLNLLREAGFQVHVKASNKGVSDSRNMGIQLAKGKYILPLDADDRILPSYLGKAVRALDEGCDVVYCNTQRFGDDQAVLRFHGFSIQKLLAANFITSCSAYRKETWTKTGGYDTAAPNLEDWEFWIAVAKTGAVFHHLDEVLFEYRSRQGSRNSDCVNASKRHAAISYICSKHADLYSIHAIEVVPNLYDIITTLENSLNLHKQLLSENFFMKAFRGFKLLRTAQGRQKILNLIRKR